MHFLHEVLLYCTIFTSSLLKKKNIKIHDYNITVKHVHGVIPFDIQPLWYCRIWWLFFPTNLPQVHWTLNDCAITGQEYFRGHLQYLVGSRGGCHTLQLPTTTKLQGGRIAIVAENPVGKAVSAATLTVHGKYIFFTYIIIIFPPTCGPATEKDPRWTIPANFQHHHHHQSVLYFYVIYISHSWREMFWGYTWMFYLYNLWIVTYRTLLL